ncbi:NAD-dependent epimerase/dehydratase family protein [bacterium]|nr:NAD-dependent epimerase/dehydratase family protein [bacterium]
MQKSNGIVLITGAAGFVGSYVVKEFLESGHTVRAFVRSSSNLAQLARVLGVAEEGLADVAGLSFAVGDITEFNSLDQAMDGVATVIHIAALFREAKHGEDMYRRVNIEGTRNVLEAAERAGVAKVVHCSTVGVHSHIPNPPANEDEEYRPGDIYQETKCEGEKVALDFFQKSRVNGVVIRPAMIWGPGDERTLKLFKGILKGRFPFIGWGKTYLHWVSVIDLAKAFRLAAETEIPSGEVFIIAGKESILLKDLLGKIAMMLGRTPTRLRLPALPFQVAGTLCELLCRPLGIEPPLHRRRVDFFTKTRAFSTMKAAELLQYEPRGSIDDEIREIIQWYEQHDWQVC